MTITVVICTRNRPRDLAACLDAVGEQTHLPRQVVVVDASDEASSARQVAAWAAGRPIAVEVVRTAPGLTRQRNLGVRRASGAIVTFLDDDVVLEPGYLAAVAELFALDPGLGGVEGVIATPPLGGRRRLVNALRAGFLMNSIGRRRGVKRSGFVTYDPWPPTVRLVTCLSGCNMSYRRTVFGRFCFDEWYDGYGLGEDKDFSYRVGCVYRLAQTPYARLEHRQSPAGRQRQPALQEMGAVNHYYFVKKNLRPTPLTWLAFAWSELGELLTLAKAGAFAAVGGRLRGYRRILAEGTVRPAAVPEASS
jgi:GT2 family glycosyltransferase